MIQALAKGTTMGKILFWGHSPVSQTLAHKLMQKKNTSYTFIMYQGGVSSYQTG